MKGSVIVVGFFVLGIICGVMHILPGWVNNPTLSSATLFVLLFAVGMSVGHDSDFFKQFRQLDRRYLLLPLMTILGTWMGCFVVAWFLSDLNLSDCLAISSGFGYYSLSSMIISNAKGPELGTIALMANIIREVITLLGAPLLVRIFGRLAPISSGGATTMDTTLPIITETCGHQFVMVSLFHGFVVDFSAPFLVPLFL